MTNIYKLDAFTTAYIEAALWSSTDDAGAPLDDNYDICDIAPETLAQMVEDCTAFQNDNQYLIFAAEDSDVPYDYDRAGHDFWLTRCGHGAGFWDRGLGKVGGKLTAAAKVYGNVDLYIGDDGLIYGAILHQQR